MDLGGQMTAAAAVLVLLGALLWWLRRRGWAAATAGRAVGRRLQTMERLALGPQHSLHLVRLGEEALLVACSPSGCALLDRVPARTLADAAGARP